MQRMTWSALAALAFAQHVAAAGVVRIADGDCAGLKAAVAAAVAGSGTTTILLASRGSYGYCPIAATGNLTIDGRGSNVQVSTSPDTAAIQVSSSAHMSLRNLNLVPTPAPIPPGPGSDNCGFNGHSWCGPSDFGVVENDGDLALDSVSLSGVPYDTAGSLISNTGTLTMRNTSIVDNDGKQEFSPTIANAGHVEIFNSTISGNAAGNTGMIYGDAPATEIIANSILVQNGGPNCHYSTVYTVPPPTSLGGNVTDDTSCAFAAAHDRLVANAGLGVFGTHGGLTASLALSADSPAIANGLIANCEGADARGAARGRTACDSGAYEFGGGQGQLALSGASGLYFNPQNNGHYVTVQRVADDRALVIWNTFDEAGNSTWVYGVGAIDGGHIHVDQVAENLGGVLRPGGAVDGATPTLWGSLDLAVGNCRSATLNYNSPSPRFGSGSVNLQRLTYITDLDCSP